MLIVRRLEAEDRRAAAEIEKLCFHGDGCQADFAEVCIKELALYDGERGVGFVVTEIPESTHLCTMCEPKSPRVIAHATVLFAPEEGQIINVATHPEHRRRGAGRMLMAAIEADARQRGFTLLSLEVRVSNEPAIRLYTDFGFTVAGRRRGFYSAPREDAFVMLKTLT